MFGRAAGKLKEAPLCSPLQAAEFTGTYSKVLVNIRE